MAFKVLIVDDEPDVEVLIRQRFRKEMRNGEYEFVFAQHGAQALEQLRNDPSLEIIMTDINMPVMDGLTLLANLPQVDRVLKAAMEWNDGPCLVEAEVIKEDNVFPMIPAGAALRDMIIERPKQKMAKPEGST